MTICYFGTYNRDFSKNKIYVRGLRDRGHTVIECADHSPGLRKYIRLWQMHRKLRGAYDVMVVGYPGHIVVPLAWLISRRPIVFDALCPLADGMISSRSTAPSPFYRLKIFLIDWLAFRLPDIVLVESEHQRAHVARSYGIREGKLRVLYTSADDSVFYPDPSVAKRTAFTVVFRGNFLPEAGVNCILKAAELLKNEGVSFLILGNRLSSKEVVEYAEHADHPNVEFILRYLPDDELRQLMLGAHASLGQFADHERLARTIPHKLYESLALGLPYVTSRATGVEELLADRETCLFTSPGDAADLAAKLLALKDDSDLRENLSRRGRELYEKRLSSRVVSEKLEHLLEEVRAR